MKRVIVRVSGVVVAAGIFTVFFGCSGLGSKMVNEETWVPVSTSLKAGQGTEGDPEGVWTAHTRPDFGIKVRLPSTWYLDTTAQQGHGALSASFGPSPEAYYGMVIIMRSENPEDIERGRGNFTSVFKLKNHHTLDKGSAVINGMEAEVTEVAGFSEVTQARYHLMRVEIQTDQGKGRTIVAVFVKEDRYRQYAPALVEMFSTMVSLDPVVAARAGGSGEEAPTTRAAARWPDLSTPAALGGNGEGDAAVIVGVEDYFVAPDVAGASQNAQDWFSHLNKGVGIPLGRVRLLRDNEGTVEDIEAALVEMAALVEPGARLWFVFIGHGAPSKDGRDGLLVGVDAQQTARSIDSRSLPRSRLLALMAKGRQAQSVVVLDACFSGKTPSGVLAPGLQPMIPVREAPSTGSGQAVIFSAGASDQFAGPLVGASRPAFSYLVLGALRGWADADSDRRVTAGEVLAYTRDVLGVAVSGRRQTPELFGESGAFLSERATERGPDVGAIVTGAR